MHLSNSNWAGCCGYIWLTCLIVNKRGKCRKKNRGFDTSTPLSAAQAQPPGFDTSTPLSATQAHLGGLRAMRHLCSGQSRASQLVGAVKCKIKLKDLPYFNWLSKEQFVTFWKRLKSFQEQVYYLIINIFSFNRSRYSQTRRARDHSPEFWNEFDKKSLTTKNMIIG